MKPVSYTLFISILLFTGIVVTLVAQTPSPTVCIDTSLINKTIVCPDYILEVCGCNGVTYSSPCIAENYYGVTSYTIGPCKSTGGCQASFRDTVDPAPVAAGEIDIAFINTSSGGSIYLWNFGDGTSSTGQNPDHIFKTDTPYYVVCLTITDTTGITASGAAACSSTTCDTVRMPGTTFCQAEFSYCSLALGALGVHFQFTNTSAGGYTQLLWTFSDGDTSTQPDPTHAFVTAGPYSACLSVSNPGATSSGGCTSTICDTLSTNSAPCNSTQPCQASFTDSVVPAPVAYGLIDIAFTNTSTGGASYLWNFGDGTTSTAQNPDHIFKTDTTYYVVCLTITDTASATSGGVTSICTSTVCDTVIIPNPTPVPCQAAFTTTILPVTTPTSSVDVQFTNTSTGPYTQSLWAFGDGDNSTAPDPSHLFAPTKPFYIVCLTISDSSGNCNSAVCDTVHIPASKPCIDSNLISDTIACPAIYNPVCGCNGVTYNNACEAEYRYGVTSWTPGACGSSGVCQASFYVSSISSAAVSYEYHFTNTSTGGYTSSVWSFGDGESSTAKDPNHLYTVHEPFYVVCLTISGSLDSCSSTYCDTIHTGPPADCIDSSLIDKHAVCPDYVLPVCGCNGVTYPNACIAENYFGVTSWKPGPCNGHIVWPTPFGGGPVPGIKPSPAVGGGRVAGMLSVDEETLALMLYPNPAEDQTNISYNLDNQANVAVDVIDMLGRSVLPVYNGNQDAGQQLLTISTGNMSNGIYLVRLNINGQVFTRQLSVVH